MKKLFSFMLTLVMLVACLSSTAFAEEREPEESYTTPKLVSSAYSLVDDTESVPGRANTNLSFTNLAKGYDLDTAVERAKDYISGALAAMLYLGKGSGPMNHGFAIKEEW